MDQTVLDLFRVKAVDGEVGVEVELEIPDNRQFPVLRQYWRGEHDGSLRGTSIEYVLNKPYARDRIHLPLRYLERKFNEIGVEPKYTGRAGTHVHINVQDLTVSELITMVCLYMIFEETIVQWCGEYRVGNLFCLRICDAEGILSILTKAIKTDRLRATLRTDNIRYAALNLKALTEYGSLEFRAMRSTISSDDIGTCVDIMLRLKDAARKINSPQKLVEDMSFNGAKELFLDVFGDNTVLEFNEESCYRGVRYAQQIAYLKDNWNFKDHEVLFRGDLTEIAIWIYHNEKVDDRYNDLEPLLKVLEDATEFGLTDYGQDLLEDYLAFRKVFNYEKIEVIRD